MKREVVPLLDVMEYSDTIRLDGLDLPHSVNPEGLGVDVARLHAVMNWGNIGFLTIGSVREDTTSYTPSGLRINLDGTVSGTGTKVAHKASTVLPESEHVNKHRHEEYRRRNTALYFNTPELEQRSANTDASPVTVLDNAFRSGLWLDIQRNDLSVKRLVTELGVATTAAAFASVASRGHLFFAPEALSDFVPVAALLSLPKPMLPLLQKFTDMLPGGSVMRQAAIEAGEYPFGPAYSTMFSFRFDRALMAGRHLLGSIITEQTLEKTA